VLFAGLITLSSVLNYGLPVFWFITSNIYHQAPRGNHVSVLYPSLSNAVSVACFIRQQPISSYVQKWKPDLKKHGLPDLSFDAETTVS